MTPKPISDEDLARLKRTVPLFDDAGLTAKEAEALFARIDEDAVTIAKLREVERAARTSLESYDRHGESKISEQNALANALEALDEVAR